MLGSLHLRRDRDLLGLAALVDVGVLLDDIDVAAKRPRGTDGQIDRRDLRSEARLELLQGGVVVRVLAVHLVDEDHPRQATLVR